MRAVMALLGILIVLTIMWIVNTPDPMRLYDTHVSKTPRVTRDLLRKGPGEWYVEVNGVRRTVPSPEEQRP